MKARILIVCILFFSHLVFGQVSGVVFRDYNANGIRNTGASYNEEGVGNVTVKAYDAAGAEVGSVVTTPTGAYSFTGLTLPLRIEFIPSLVDDYSAPFGTGNGSSVQFYSAASTTGNFGINYPEHYCHTATPNIVTTCFVNGRPSTGTPQTDVLVQHPYFATGNMTSNTYLGDAGQLGSIWGVAYNRMNGDIYTSSLVKRHTAMKDNDGNGTEDIGAIYIKTPSGTPALWLDLATLPGVDVGLSLMPTIAARALPNSNNGPSYDGTVFSLVGKIGLGDLEISDDNKTLYVVSLYDKKLYSIDIATKTLIGAGIVIPSACTGGESRPFSVTYHRGKIYIGTVCDAITSQLEPDLKATVYRLDGGTFTNILSFPLNYVKGAAFEDYDQGTGLHGTKWNPWEDVFDNQKAFFSTSINAWAMIHPQPILANIEFDHDEAMILVFNDRNGHQMGTANYGISSGTHGTTLHTSVAAGDILRACIASGTYQLEVNGSCGGTTTTGAGNNQGPATINGTMNGYTGTGGEYYWGDQALIYGSAVYHKDAVMGGSTLLAGSGKTYVHMVDAYEAWGGGSYLMSNTTGNFTSVYGIYPATVTEVLFGKANGLGDPEVMCNMAPIEIGNRVWVDTDNDGIQDAGEASIAGVTVQLLQGTTVIGTATTDANGNYYFSNNTGTSTASSIYGITQLEPNMAYTVRIPNVQGGSKQAALGVNTLTTANVGGAGQPDVRDSDGTLVGVNAEVTVVTTDIPTAGANNHNFDFGFSAVTCVTPTATAASTNPSCAGSTAQSNGMITISGFTVGQRYQYTSGATFSGTATPASITAIPVGGVIVNNLANTTQQYTVRIYDATDDVCFIDRTVSITAATCGSCNCKEYIYLNEPLLSSVLKFEVGSAVPLTEVLGANGGTIPPNHWYPGTNASELPSPHGLATDLNGNLYIGNVDRDGIIRKFNCDGVITPTGPTTINNPSHQQNIFSIGNIIYVNSDGGPTAYNSCTGVKIGQLCLNQSDGDNLWGLSYNEVTEMVYATRRTPGQGKVWVFTRAQLEAGIAANGTICIDPILSQSGVSTINLGDSYIPNVTGGAVFGITSDNLGNFYVIQSSINGGLIGSGSVVLKYNSAGQFVAMTPISFVPSGSYSFAIGIVWSESNRLYVSNLTDDPSTDCISVFDANTMTYLGAGAPNPGLPSNNSAKAIAIIKECCPSNLPATFQKEVCGAVGTKFYLNQEAFDECDGIVCGSSWIPVGTLTNMTFDACDNSVIVTGPGCGTFTLNIGAVISTGCGAQTSTFTICNTVPSATVAAGPAGTCTGSTPNSDAVINITAATNANQAGISTGATYTGPIYNGAGTVAITGGIAAFTGRMHNTQYTVRIFNGSNDCFVDYTITTPTVTCCALAVTCTPVSQTSCTPVNGSASVSATGAVGTLTYIWSSGETTSSISSKGAGTYIVTVTDGGVAGCSRTCQAVITSTATLPTAVCTPVANTNCATPNGSASVSTNAPSATYVWSNNATTSSITGLNAGTYIVTVTNTTTGCTNTCQAVVTTTTTLPTATCVPVANSNCGSPNGSATVTTNANQILWSNNATTSSINGLSAGTYTVTVTNTTTGCTNTCQAVVTNATVSPTCSITTNSQPSCANLTGGSITVVPSPAGTYTYTWSDNGAATANRTGLTGGTYTVTVTNTTSNCTGVCNVTLTTPTNCCNISTVVPQNVVCYDNGTPSLSTDNRIRFSANITNTNTSLTSYNVSINGGTTITPNTNVPYGLTQFTLGPGTAGGGATFTVTVTDSATPGCTQTFQIVDPGLCSPGTSECPPVQCGSATIQTNGN